MKKLKKSLISMGALVTAAVLFTAPTTSYADSTTPLPYTDIENSPALGQILVLNQLGLINGYPDQTFRPNGSITRAEFAKMLVNGEGLSSVAAELANTKSQFHDISGWETGYINVASAKGWINGYGNGKFGPNDPITNAQAIVILMRAIGIQESQNVNPWYTNYLLAAHNLKNTLVSNQQQDLGFAPQTLNPDADATRAFVSGLITTLLELPMDPTTNTYNFQNPSANTKVSLNLSKDVISSVTQGTSTNASITFTSGQTVSVSNQAKIYGNLLPGNTIWYLKDANGFINFVYAVGQFGHQGSNSGVITSLNTLNTNGVLSEVIGVNGVSYQIADPSKVSVSGKRISQGVTNYISSFGSLVIGDEVTLTFDSNNKVTGIVDYYQDTYGIVKSIVNTTDATSGAPDITLSLQDGRIFNVSPSAQVVGLDGVSRSIDTLQVGTSVFLVQSKDDPTLIRNIKVSKF